MPYIHPDDRKKFEKILNKLAPLIESPGQLNFRRISFYEDEKIKFNGDVYDVKKE